MSLRSYCFIPMIELKAIPYSDSWLLNTLVRI